MKLIRYAALAASLAVGLGAGAVTAAQAGHELCPKARVCVYVNRDFQGLMGFRGGGEGIRDITTPNNDQMSSWENLTRFNAAWYHNINGRGKCLDMPAGQELNFVGLEDNDAMSSWKTNGKCS